MRAYCIAQGTLLNALWWSKWGGNQKKGDSVCFIAETNTAS